MLTPTLHIETSQVHPEQMQRVHDNYDRVVNDIGKADTNRDESKYVAHFSTYIIIEEKKEHAKGIYDAFFDNVLPVNDLVLPLAL